MQKVSRKLRSIYRFAQGSCDPMPYQSAAGKPNAATKELVRRALGGKGYHLVRMAQEGYPVPDGLVIPAPKVMAIGQECTDTYQDVRAAISAYIADVGASNFLPVSVRSGARVSMPGMMDTILNVGCTYIPFSRLGKRLGSQRAALDTCIRFWLMFGETVYDLDTETLRAESEQATTLSAKKKCVSKLRECVTSGEAMPPDPVDAIMWCVQAVARSWHSERAVAYRQRKGIPDKWGTACVVQRMVFGNAAGRSYSGVAFSHDSQTGALDVNGQYVSGQGEDVVSGMVDTEPLTRLPAPLRKRLDKAVRGLVADFGGPQDVEFTFERGTLYILQTRALAIQGRAKLHSLPITPRAINKVTEDDLRSLYESWVDTATEPYAVGEGASPGAVAGTLVETPDEVSRALAKGKIPILAAVYTSAHDVPMMMRCGGVLTSVGGYTSHAAVVARSLGIPAVTGVGGEAFTTLIDFKTTAGVTLDGRLGQVWRGVHPVVSGGFMDTGLLCKAWSLLDAAGRLPEGAIARTLIPLVGVPCLWEMDVALLGRSPEFVRSTLKNSDLTNTWIQVYSPKCVSDPKRRVQVQVKRLLSDAEVLQAMGAAQALMLPPEAYTPEFVECGLQEKAQVSCPMPVVSPFVELMRSVRARGGVE